MSVIRRPRVGHIQFLNCLPIYWGLMRSGALVDVELTRADPDVLNDALVAGDLDIGPISLVEYLRNADTLDLLPGVAVGSDGPVLSVHLVHSRPLAELDGRPLALGSTSRTSVVLARMLLAERYGAYPEYFNHAPDLDAMLAKADAAVVIGDVALRARFRADSEWVGRPDRPTVTDLGEAWRDWTGLPMVFAVWGVRKEYAAAHPGLVKGVHEAFQRSLRLCLAEIDDVAASASRWEPFDAPTLAHYFRTLDFSLGDRQVAGLREFARRAAGFGAVPGLPAGGPRFVDL